MKICVQEQVYGTFLPCFPFLLAAKSIKAAAAQQRKPTPGGQKRRREGISRKHSSVQSRRSPLPFNQNHLSCSLSHPIVIVFAIDRFIFAEPFVARDVNIRFPCSARTCKKAQSRCLDNVQGELTKQRLTMAGTRGKVSGNESEKGAGRLH